MDPLAELARYARPRALRWEAPAAAAFPRDPAPAERDVLAALETFGVLSTPQLGRRFFPGLSPRAVRHRLLAMAEQGWLRRGHLVCAGPGQTPRLCAPAGAPPTDLDRVVHTLHLAAWWFAYERLRGGTVVRPAGARAADLVLDELRVVLRRVPPGLADLAEADERPLLLVLADEPTAIAAAHALARRAPRALFTAEPEIHAGRLRAVRVRDGELALVDLLRFEAPAERAETP